MARTQQEYADEYYLKGKAQAEERYKQRQANDEKQIQTMTNTVQKATEAQMQPYQTQMEELPDPYRELHDANALAEMVGQRQVKEAMANMGLSDSGLNRTQLTALAVQRGNADADLRRDRQRRTQELQDRIAHIRNTGQLEIEQQTAAIRGETDNWYNTALDTVYTNAQALGASAYAADQKVEAEKLAAQRAADLRLAQELQLEAVQKQEALYDRWLKQQKAQTAKQPAVTPTRSLRDPAGPLVETTKATTKAPSKPTERAQNFIKAMEDYNNKFLAVLKGDARKQRMQEHVKEQMMNVYMQKGLNDEEMAYIIEYFGL